MNSLYCYFKPTAGVVVKRQDKQLPDPNGPLSAVVPPEAIRDANDAYSKTCSPLSSRNHTRDRPMERKRGVYAKLTPVQQAQTAKHAFAFGNQAAIRRYAREFRSEIKDSSVSTWKAKYVAEMKRLLKESGSKKKDVEVKSLPQLKQGRPPLLGDDIDRQVISYIKELREKKGIIITAVTVASGEAIVNRVNKGLLKENGGPIELTSVWAKSLHQRINFVKRKATTSGKVEPSHFKELKEQFLLDIKAVVDMEDVPSDLILNWDHTGINVVPGSQWTMEAKGSKRVEAAGINDKRQITAVFCGALNGELLPLQLIYQGKTPACLPRFVFPQDWNVTFTPNHWSNEQKTEEYIEKIILPYVTKRREEHGKPNQTALVIFDEFKGQVTDDVYNMLDSNNIQVVKVPPNCTDRLQPMDLSINKPVKDFLRGKFQKWYSLEVKKGYCQPGNVVPVDLRMSTMKPLGAGWLVGAYNYIKGKDSMVKNGFTAAGITDIISKVL